LKLATGQHIKSFDWWVEVGGKSPTAGGKRRAYRKSSQGGAGTVVGGDGTGAPGLNSKRELRNPRGGKGRGGPAN